MSLSILRARLRFHVASLLRAHRYAFRLSLSAGHIFAWLFIFELSFALSASVTGAMVHTLMLYALSQVVLYFVTPYVATEIGQGVRQLMFAGILMFVAACTFLATILNLYVLGVIAPWTLIGFAILMGLYRAFYWVPYHAEIDAFHPHGRTQQYIHELTIAVAPFFVGLLLVSSSTASVSLLYMASGLALVSTVPLFWLPEKKETFLWSYREALESVYDSRHSSVVWRMVADGFQGAIALVVWPLAIFLMSGWSYFVVGGIISVVLLVSPIARDIYKRVLKHWNLERSLPVQLVVVISAWVLRTTVGSPLAVVVVDTYARTGIQHAHIDAASFEQAADGGVFLDKYSVLKELGLTIGRIVAAVVAIIAFIYMSVPEAFITLCILAACAAAISVTLAVRGTLRPF